MSLYSPSATELRVGQEDFREKKICSFEYSEDMLIMYSQTGLNWCESITTQKELFFLEKDFPFGERWSKENLLMVVLIFPHK